MATENKYFTWVEPTVTIQKSLTHKTSYILYNKISNFKINNDKFKIVHVDTSNDKSMFIKFKYDYRLAYISYLKNLYPESYSTDSGFSAIIDAIKYTNENLILLYKNFVLIGAVSYSINNKKQQIEISHIGVIEKRKRYGSILMNEIFLLAKILMYQVFVTSNGYADDFYHSCGMQRIVDKPLGIYTIKADYIKDLEYLQP